MITAVELYRTYYQIYRSWMSPGECAVEVDLLNTQIRLVGEFRGKNAVRWRESVRYMRIKRYTLKKLLKQKQLIIQLHNHRKDIYGQTHN